MMQNYRSIYFILGSCNIYKYIYLCIIYTYIYIYVHMYIYTQVLYSCTYSDRSSTTGEPTFPPLGRYSMHEGSDFKLKAVGLWWPVLMTLCLKCVSCGYYIIGLYIRLGEYVYIHIYIYIYLGDNRTDQHNT